MRKRQLLRHRRLELRRYGLLQRVRLRERCMSRSPGVAVHARQRVRSQRRREQRERRLPRWEVLLAGRGCVHGVERLLYRLVHRWHVRVRRYRDRVRFHDGLLQRQL